MKILSWALVICMALSAGGDFAYSGEDVSEQNKVEEKSGGNEALTGAIIGGLLGGGIGTAIGSAYGKAGTGALIGAGVGAVGGTIVGASQADSKKSKEAPPLKEEPPKGAKIKKKVIREYDENGNVISEKEVKE